MTTTGYQEDAGAAWSHFNGKQEEPKTVEQVGSLIMNPSKIEKKL